jgi:PPOX class probable F420-dependent enzyme
VIDLTTEFGATVARRLAEEEVIWLTTVGADGTPQPSPVWFLWEDGELLIYSQPDKPKVKNLLRQPRVALNFNTDAQGDSVAVLIGEARVDGDAPAIDRHAAYLEKYRAGIARLGSNAEDFAKTYTAAIRVRPTKLRGW